MKNDDVLIVLINWNGWNDTKECLDSILKLESIDYSVAIVDNGSDTDCTYIAEYGKKNFNSFHAYSKEEIKSLSGLPHPEKQTMTLIENNDNLGFAAANNIALRYASLTGFELIYLLNNDTIVDPQSLYRLKATLDSSNYTAVVPQIRYYDPKDVVWCCGGEIKDFYEHYYFKDQKVSSIPDKKIIDITFATGCALLFKKSEVKQLSERFFFGEEDFELSLRLKKNGLKMACVVDAIIYHKESVSINRSTKYLNKIYVHKLNRLINIKTYARLRWPLMVFYRSFKFFLLMFIVEKIGLKKSLKYSFLLAYQAVCLNEVNKDLFFKILAFDLSQ